MSGAQIFALAIAAVAVLAAIAIFAVAFRREPKQAATGTIQRRDETADRRRQAEVAAITSTATEADEVAAEAEAGSVLTDVEPEPVPDPIAQRPALSEEEYGVTRRKFFTRGVLAIFGIFMLQFALGGLAFFWPKLRSGAFGSAIAAGDIDEIKAQLFNDDGTVTPFFVPAAQAYVMPFQGDITVSNFEGKGVIADGLMALWQRCVHLGCRVPYCDSSQGFECPCHGSKYNREGQYEAGPAPRNLDRFVVSVSDDNVLIIDTGAVIQTPRAKIKTVGYPQGPSCLSA